MQQIRERENNGRNIGLCDMLFIVGGYRRRFQRGASPRMTVNKVARMSEVICGGTGGEFAPGFRFASSGLRLLRLLCANEVPLNAQRTRLLYQAIRETKGCEEP